MAMETIKSETKDNKLTIFDEQISRKPNLYPWTETFIEAMHNGFWTDKEFNFSSDIQQFKVSLSEKEKEILKRKGVKWSADGTFSPITETQQLDPELNILIGSIYLGQYADSITGQGQKPAFATENGILRIDRIVPLFNTGENSDDSKDAIAKKHATAVDTANNAKKPVTRDYIHKILGVGGTMDIMSKELKDVIVA
jgi:hypothetical protein